MKRTTVPYPAGKHRHRDQVAALRYRNGRSVRQTSVLSLRSVITHDCVEYDHIHSMGVHTIYLVLVVDICSPIEKKFCTIEVAVPAALSQWCLSVLVTHVCKIIVPMDPNFRFPNNKCRSSVRWRCETELGEHILNSSTYRRHFPGRENPVCNVVFRKRIEFLCTCENNKKLRFWLWIESNLQ